MTSNSIPVKVLFDALNTVVSLELVNGEVYNGTLTEVQDNMNVLLTDATKTSKSGHTTTNMKSVLLRGANIVFFVLPDALQTSPALMAAGKAVSKALDTRGDGKGFGAATRKRRLE